MTTLYRPAGIGLLLDRALGVYRLHWRAIMGAALMFLFPVALLGTVSQVFSQRELFTIIQAVASRDPSALAVTQNNVWLTLIQTVGWIGSILWAAANAWFYTGVLTCAPEMAQGRPVTARRLLTAGAPRFWNVVAITVASGAVLLVPIAGMVVVVFWAVAIPVAVVEAAPFDRALGRSWKLVSSVGFWRTVLFWIALGLIVFALEQVALAPNVIRQIFDGLRDPGALFRPLSIEWTVFSGILAGLGLALAAPFSMLATYLYYADARARAEGMDLLQQARALAPAPAGAAVPEGETDGPPPEAPREAPPGPPREAPPATTPAPSVAEAGA